MSPQTLARKRASGELPYKVHVTDWRRLRWRVPVHVVTREQFAAIEVATGVAVSVALRHVFTVQRKKRPHE